MNRGFLYGDGFFETIRTVNGSIPLLGFHLKRILLALNIYQMDAEQEMNEDWLSALISPHEHPNHLIRISFYRDGAGTYCPMNNYFRTHLRVSEASNAFWLPSAHDLSAELDKAPLVLGNVLLYPDPKPVHPTLTVKSLSSVYYVLAAKYMAQNKGDHLLLQDHNGHLLEELRSNIYIQTGNDLFTPPKDAGQVIGASEMYMRLYYGPQMTERELTQHDLHKADAVYCSRGSIGLIRIK